MRPAEVSYTRAIDLNDVGQLLKTRGGARLIAGGQGLLRDMRMREVSPEVIVDISRLRELDYIRRDGDVLEIGAVTTLADVAGNDEVRTGSAALAEAARRVGDVQIRSRGTVGGNVCGPWSPAGWSADIGTVLTASGGSLVVHSADGGRTIDAEAFTGSQDYPLAAHEVISALRFGLAQGSAYYRLSRRWADASTGAAAAFADLRADGGLQVRVAVGRVHNRIVRLRDVEAAVAAHGVDAPEVDEALAAAAAGFTPVDDVHADGPYRIAVLPVIVKRAIAQAVQNAGGIR